VHGHFVNVPEQVTQWRARQILDFEEHGGHLSAAGVEVSDDEIRDALLSTQLPIQRERGTSVTLFSPIAGQAAPHQGDQETSLIWTRLFNDIVGRAARIFPGEIVGVCQLPQSITAKSIVPCVEELERCVNELGFVGCNLNPDPSDGYWQVPPLTSEFYYPLYEKMVELDVPAMVHGSASINPAVPHPTCSHYINIDTTAFMQLCLSDVFKTFPELKIIIPHGGGAVPYHWGRYRGVMRNLGRGELDEFVRNNIFFDTCVYWLPGIRLLVESVPAANILYAAEVIGAVRGIDPDTNRRYDDTKFLLDSVETLSEADRVAIAGGNAIRVFGRLSKALTGAAT
jgi:4-oxalmesaconate hydratase